MIHVHSPFSSHRRVVDSQASEWERTYAMFNHLSLLIFHVIPIPVVPALVMWLIKRDRSPFVDDHGREAVNFQISLLIYGLISGVLIPFLIGIPLMVATYLLGIVGMVFASIAANRGEYYRYPMCIRLVSR